MAITNKDCFIAEFPQSLQDLPLSLLFNIEVEQTFRFNMARLFYWNLSFHASCTCGVQIYL